MGFNTIYFPGNIVLTHEPTLKKKREPYYVGKKQIIPDEIQIESDDGARRVTEI